MSWTIWLAHVGVGTLALGTFWRTATTRKGSRSHVRAGRLHLLAMLVILVTVFAILVEIVTAGDGLRAVRLVYLMLIVVTATWLAWRAVRDRSDARRFAGPVFLILATAMAGCGLAFLAVGLRSASALTIGFALIGLLFGIAMWRFALRGPSHGKWWLGWHLNGVCLLFAATHDSFVGLGLRSLFPSVENPTTRAFVFFTVLALAAVARLWLGRKYLRAPTRPVPRVGYA